MSAGVIFKPLLQALLNDKRFLILDYLPDADECATISQQLHDSEQKMAIALRCQQLSTSHIDRFFAQNCCLDAVIFVSHEALADSVLLLLANNDDLILVINAGLQTDNTRPYYNKIISTYRAFRLPQPAEYQAFSPVCYAQDFAANQQGMVINHYAYSVNCDDIVNQGSLLIAQNLH